MAFELTERFLADTAGWEAMKQARGLLATGKVLSSNWTPPVLKGVVQEGTVAYRAGLVIRSERDLENLCTCRASREWGMFCAHSIAVGLHHLKRVTAETAAAAPPNRLPAPARPTKPRSPGRRLVRAEAETAGVPATIFVILPPNLAAALERGKAMLCFEGEWPGGRAPLNALPASQPFRFSAQDTALLDAIELLAGGDTPAMLLIGTRDFAALLPLLADHPRVTLGRSEAVTVSAAPWPLPLRATLEPNGEIVLALKAEGRPPLVIEPGWVWQNRTFQPLSLPESCQAALRGPVRFKRCQVPPFLSADWPRLQAAGGVEANFRLEDFTLEPQAPRFLLHLTGGLAQLHAQLQGAYRGSIVTVGVTAAEAGFWLPDPDSPVRYSTRDLAAERAALGRLLRAGFTGPDDQGRHRLLGENAVLNFLARDFPRLQKEWAVTLEERLERTTMPKLERIEPRFEITSSGVQWFDFGVAFETRDGQKFAPAEIQRLLLAGQSHVRLRNGRTALIDTGAVEELQQVLLDCAPEQQAGRYRLAQTQAGFLEATLTQLGWQAKAPGAWRDRARQQAGEVARECPPLGDLEPVLRPYQKQGVAWLQFLRENGFGGILADEMGLGKTLQTLAFLRSTRALATAPALVVCPTSLVFNWVAEAQKFTPELKVLALHGPDRHALFDRVGQSDLVVTSYALIRRDVERYRGWSSTPWCSTKPSTSRIARPKTRRR